jgi:two-component system response regulator
MTDGFTLLYADDDDERLLLDDAWDVGGFEQELKLLEGGQQAVAAVREHVRAPARGPVLLMVDLNMPDMSGADVVRALKADSKTRHIPIVVFSSSDDPKDRARLYAEGASSYIVKPDTFDDVIEHLRRFTAYWGEVAALP